MTQFNIFKELHIPGNPLFLVNVWDAGSAKAVTRHAKAIATSSWSIAASMGYEDGENIPFDFLLKNISQITAHSDLPVTVDIESGYGATVSEIQHNVQRLIDVGVVGINIEDKNVVDGQLYSIPQQQERIKAVRYVSKDLFINARCDVFFKEKSENSEIDDLNEAIARRDAYKKAGADGFFVPGLLNNDLIRVLCEGDILPINIMVLPGSTVDYSTLKDNGVARISYGPGPYINAMATLSQFAEHIYAQQG